MGARPSGFTPTVHSAEEIPNPHGQVLARVWSPEQQAIFNWFESSGDQLPDDPLSAIGGGHLSVDAVAGCLAGDTIVGINRGGKSFNIRLDQLVLKQNSMGDRAYRSRWGGACWDRNIPTTIRAEDPTGYVQIYDLTAAVASGEKETYLVELEDGRTLRGTRDHRVRTVDGWWGLGYLRPGSMVFVEQPVVGKEASRKPYYRGTVINGVKEAEHRLVVEAGMNNLSLRDYIAARRAGLIPLHRLGVRQVVHHKNGDTLDNRPSNLLVMGGLAEHSKHHAHLSAWRYVTPLVAPVAVRSIKDFGVEPTYDLTVAEAENFLANGIVVHNSGKTTTLIEGVTRAPEQNPLVCAFNKRIADELNTRLQRTLATAKTLHGLGYGLIRRHWKGMPVAQDDDRCEQITRAVVAQDTPTPIRRLVSKLHTKAREMCPLDWDEDVLTELALRFDCEPDDGWKQYDLQYVVHRAGEALAHATTTAPTRAVGIDYADMVFLPLAWDLTSREYDLTVVDERQDMTAAQLELAMRVSSGRICLVGDRHQCQPAGTKVRTVHGDVPIEHIEAGDSIASWDRHSSHLIQSAKVNAVASRDYAGELYSVGAGSESARCTPNHKWVVRWADKPTTVWMLYLMQKGTSFRVGQCQMFRQTSDGVQLGLQVRVSQERADAAWILGLYGSHRDALTAERIVSAQFGLPELCFEATNHTIFSPEMIDTVWATLGDLTINAKRCLAAFERMIEYPFYQRTARRLGRQTLFEIEAVNLLDGLMSIPVPVDKRRIAWHPITVSKAPFVGRVYSLDVARHHKYVSDGLVTCNSIYGFRGADIDGYDRLRQMLQARELPLSTTYRCATSIVERAQRLVPHIQAVAGAPEGTVSPVEYDQMLREVAPGDFILSRLNAPLVGITLALLRTGTRARMAGRDIGAGINTLITKRLKVFPGMPLTELCDRLDRWERQQVQKYAERGLLQMVDQTHDQAGMIRALAEDADTTKALLDKIWWLFSDVANEDQIVCSSIHKAKGLEATTVWGLQESLYRRGDSQEERNLDYVMTTRAKTHLKMVEGVPSLTRR